MKLKLLKKGHTNSIYFRLVYVYNYHAYKLQLRQEIPQSCAQSLNISFLPNHIFFCRYKASGIRLDSGDLAYLSIEARKVFRAVEKEFNVPGFAKMVITASNDLNEETIDALNKQVINLSCVYNLSRTILPFVLWQLWLQCYLTCLLVLLQIYLYYSSCQLQI